MRGNPTEVNPTEIKIPPARTLMVRERQDDGSFRDVAYYGHNVQTTECGGLNILRITMSPLGPVQQMVVGLPPHSWQRIWEDIDLSGTSPLSIVN